MQSCGSRGKNEEEKLMNSGGVNGNKLTDGQAQHIRNKASND